MNTKNTLVGAVLVAGSILGVESLDRWLGRGPWIFPLAIVGGVIAIIGIGLMVKDIDLL